MFTFVKRGCLLFFLFVLMAVKVGAAQQNSEKAAKGPAEPTGKEMFVTYCASCHGSDGKGNGPVAPALKQPPSDLTTLAKRNKGEFPTEYVNNVLLQGVKTPAHGNAEMPVWGPIFAGLNDRGILRLRITGLIQYLKTIQTK